MFAFLSPLFLARRARHRGADRAAPVPAQHRGGGRFPGRAAAAQGAGRARRQRRHLRELILLALRVTALLLLAFAFARPYFADGAQCDEAPVTVVAVDTSMSVSAPGQFEQVRAAARKAIDDAPAARRCSAFDDRVRVRCRRPPTAVPQAPPSTTSSPARR